MKSSYNMKRANHILTTLAVLAFILIATPLAHGQLRTWVSSTGDDGNPCNRTSPCKTFAGAISKTIIAGEIDAIDPGDFGVVTIDKSITIDGGYNFASILAPVTPGVTVNLTRTTNADPERRVVLRRLSINGTGGNLFSQDGGGFSTGIKGISALNFGKLDIENCYIQNFTQAGIDVSLSSSASRVTVKDTNINNTHVGIQVTTSTGFVTGTFDKVRIDNCQSGVIARDGGYVNIRDSIIEACSVVGASIQAPSNSAGLNLENTMLYSVETGVQAGGPGTKVDLSNTSILNNSVAISSSGGSVFSHGNNRIAYNSSLGVAPTLVGQQ